MLCPMILGSIWTTINRYNNTTISVDRFCFNCLDRILGINIYFCNNNSQEEENEGELQFITNKNQ